MLDYIWSYALEDFLHCLMELFLTGVLCCKIGHEAVYIILGKLIHVYLF